MIVLTGDQRFVNALRDFLGKGPLYARSEDRRGPFFESLPDVFPRADFADAWFSGSEGTKPILDRDEWRDVKIQDAMKRRALRFEMSLLKKHASYRRCRDEKIRRMKGTFPKCSNSAKF